MPDYNFIIDSRLRPEQLRVVNQLGRMAASQGLILYLAGAAVRDLILGFSGARDLSFVVEGNVQRILRPLTSKSAHRIDSARVQGGPANNGFDLKVGSLTLNSKVNEAHVIFEGGVGANIAMSRNEVYGSPGRPPVISPGTIFDDLRRRDFSIDAMALSLHPNSRGLLLDPTNGVADIERRELRALHSRSFFDEPVRIYRLLRLSLRLDFKPDEKTERWLGMALEERTWEHIPEEHQGRELRAILSEEQSGKLLKLLKDRDLLGGLDKKFASGRLEFDKFDRVRTAIRTANAADQEAVLLNFHTLVAKLSGADQTRLAKKILNEAKTIKTALSLEREASQLAKALAGPKINKPSQVYTLLSSAAPPLALFLLVYEARATVQNRIKAFFTKYLPARAGLPRAELQSLGLPPGPKFEKVIEQVFLDEIDGKIKSPQQMTKLLMDYAGIKPPPPAPPPAPAKSAVGKPTSAKGPKPAPSKPQAPHEQAPATAQPALSAAVAGRPGKPVIGVVAEVKTAKAKAKAKAETKTELLKPSPAPAKLPKSAGLAKASGIEKKKHLLADKRPVRASAESKAAGAGSRTAVKPQPKGKKVKAPTKQSKKPAKGKGRR